jgi:hypothetical protein
MELSEVSPAPTLIVTAVAPVFGRNPVGVLPPAQVPNSIVSEPSERVEPVAGKTSLLSACVVARELTCSEYDPVAGLFPLIEVAVATEASETVVLVCPQIDAELDVPTGLKAAAFSRKVDKALWILPNDEIFALIELCSFCRVFRGWRSMLIN